MSQATLVERVSALRRRLEEIAPPSSSPLTQLSPRLRQLQEVCRQAECLYTHAQVLEAQVHALGEGDHVRPQGSQQLTGPKALSWQVRRWLSELRGTLKQLKEIGDNLSQEIEAPTRLMAMYHMTVAMAECLVRGVQGLPEEVLEQNRFAQGLAGWLNWLKSQTAALLNWLEHIRAVSQQIATLAHAIQALSQRRPVLSRSLFHLAEELAHLEPSAPLELLTPSLPPERWAAVHGWNTAQVLTRIIRRHREYRKQTVPILLAALIHDTGMATMPASLLEQKEPLTDEQRRQVEAHVGISAEAMKLCCPEETWLVEGILAHHERLDGSGYPLGSQGRAINNLARLLAVADTYAALCTPRAYRPASSPRQAMLEVLSEAERGRLDINAAELLLGLSLYPIGTVVELSDGSIGQVITLNQDASESSPPSAIVALLLDRHAQPLPIPRYVNLADPTAPSVVRQVPVEELTQANPLGWWVQVMLA
ncbi:MAG: HD domain-containing protein [Gemmatales bacterium]|nr:HD domain-containing protein [Gemmatales bacterium]MDW7995687.1 HD domain-containing protein [Gemmatales bacterium]